MESGSNAVFKTQATPTAPAETPQGKTPTQDGASNVDVPYLDYQKEHGKPFLVDHFQLGPTYADRDGGFSEELGSIEGYINDQIKSGEISNNQEAVRDLLKGLEKMTNIKGEPRAVIRLGVLSNYCKFLQSTRSLKSNYAKYNY